MPHPRPAATRLLSLALLAASLLGGDCSKTDDTGSAGSAGAAGSSTAATAVTKCNAILDRLCTVTETCGVQDKAGCLTSNQPTIDCTKAIDVTTSYDQCVKDASALTCDDVNALFPSSCLGVVVFGAQSLAPGEGWMSRVGSVQRSAE